MNTAPPDASPPAEGCRRNFDQVERVYYEGYWIKTYPVPVDTLQAKKLLIEALTRRLFNHTEHGLNVPGWRLNDARASHQVETDPAKRRVKAAMLAGAMFNRAADIFRKLVELQAEGIEIRSDDVLMRECGQCLLDAMELGHCVKHRSGEEGIDELWGEPFRAFTIPIEDYYESRYIKISQAMRDIDRIARAVEATFAHIPAFSTLPALFKAFTQAAKIKTETMRTDADIFDVWSDMVSAAEKVTEYTVDTSSAETSVKHNINEGLQLLRNGRDLVFHIARARTSMPKSTREYSERCATYLELGSVPALPIPLPV